MTEREMKYSQGVLVTGSFEEGHFHQGILALNQLRMPGITPSPEHIRLLLYIAMYPEPSPEDPLKEQERQKKLDAMSPTKQIEEYNRELEIEATIPSTEATKAARDLLYLYTTDSISPEAILRAVPCYQLSETEIRNSPRLVNEGSLYWDEKEAKDMESWAAKDAKKLTQCKDCWSMLRPEVIKRRDAHKPLKKMTTFDDLRDDEIGLISTDIIAKDSWHVLYCLVLFFEKDEELANKSRQGNGYSILLLSQFKPINSSSGMIRSDPAPVVEIVFLCYQQSENWKRQIGRKLLILLISLTSAQTFHSPALMDAISTRLLECPHDVVVSILTDIPCHPRGRAAKISICEQYLAKNLRVTTEIMTRARPQPRGQRRDQIDTSVSPFSWSLPSSKRILGFIEPSSNLRSIQSPNLGTIFYVLFHLLITFGTFIKAASDADPYWSEALHNGQLEQLIEETFTDKHLSSEESKVVKSYNYLLSKIITNWKQNLP